MLLQFLLSLTDLVQYHSRVSNMIARRPRQRIDTITIWRTPWPTTAHPL